MEGMDWSTGLDEPCKPMTLEDFQRAVDIVSKETWPPRPPQRVYHPREYQELHDDAVAFGVDMTDPDWDMRVMEEYAAYWRFERYLRSVGWKPE